MIGALGVCGELIMCKPSISPGRPVGWRRPKELKRVKLHSFRLPLRWVRWLHKQNDSGGRLIERALEDYYGVNWDKEQ